MNKLWIVLLAAACLVAPRALGQAIAQQASGNACSTATWTGGVVPTSGNTVTLLNTGTPTLDVPFGCVFTFGTSPVSGGTTALTQNITAITVEGTLDAQGPITGGNAALSIGPGGVAYFDKSLSASPSTTFYGFTQTGTSKGNRQVNCTGTALTSPTFTGTATAGSAVITGVPSGAFASLQLNQYAVTSLWPLGNSVITGLNSGAGTVTLSSNATFSGSATVTVYSTFIGGYFNETGSDALFLNCAYAAFYQMGNTQTFTGSITSGSNVITGVTGASTLGLTVGENLFSVGVITSSSDVITAVGSTTVTNAVNFGSTVGPITIMAWRPGFAPTAVSSTVIQTLDHVIFDGGTLAQWNHSAPSGGGISLTNTTFENTQTATNINFLGKAITSGGVQLFNHNVFDVSPTLPSNGATITNNYFYATYVNTSALTATWALFDGNFVRTNSFQDPTASFFAMNGDATNNYFLLDRVDAAPLAGPYTAVSSTSGQGSTITTTGAGWTTNEFESFQAASGCSDGMCDVNVAILSGTGAGQIKNIVNNYTANTLTVMYPWVVSPDSTSTFAIYKCRTNAHWIQPGATNSTISYTGNTVESLCTDNNGDVYLQMGGTTTYLIEHNLILPNAMRDNSGVLHTIFGTETTPHWTVTNNTAWAGSQTPPAWGETGGGNLPNQITAFENNIINDDPAIIYFTAGNNSFVGQSKAFKTSDEGLPFSNATLDMIVAGFADYNSGYGLYINSTTGTYYASLHSVAPGAHDQDGNPNYVDFTRGFRKWAAHAGSTGNIIQIGDDALLKMRTMNFPDFNTAYSITGTSNSMIPWIRAGWAPTNPILHNTASDGGDIGAIPFFQSNVPNAVISGSVKLSGSAVIQ
jgi:hypothetical protein